ncbi:ankyrin 2,3/unc44 [Thraustotheca clavata]|uniref:Ankyrin 2,3/unc44 n=1 Tax=Thraustotheca clavata TaxID=74557 RepID=A0A1V9Z9B5_9STRA|nr:ankyrin 2,3/unc44 [Thraustotheca clavata]
MTSENPEDIYKELRIAVAQGKYDLVSKLLHDGADVNYQKLDGKTKGWTLLHGAAFTGKEEIVNLLIENNATIDLKDEMGKTPLMLAIERRQNKVADILFLECVKLGNRQQVMIYLKNKDNDKMKLQEALCEAVRRQNALMVSLLLAFYEVENEDSNTLLEIAVEKGNSLIVQLLLENNEKRKHQMLSTGVSLLYMACANGHDKLIPLLITKENANGDNDENGSPLYMAAEKDFTKVVEELLKSSHVDVDFVHKSKATALHTAAENGHLAIVSIMLENKAKVDVLNEINETPLHLASRAGNAEIVALLIGNGANINAKSNDDNTPLHEAAKHGHNSILRILLKAKADTSLTNQNGETAEEIVRSKECINIDIESAFLEASNENELIAAVKEGDDEKIRQLLDVQICPNLIDPNNDNDPLLHTAIELGNEKVLCALIQSTDIDLNILNKNQTNSTAIGNLSMVVRLLLAKPSIAKKHEMLLQKMFKLTSTRSKYHHFIDIVVKNKTQLLEQLLENGADPNTSDEARTSLLHVASRNDCVEMIKLLIKYKARIDAQDMNQRTPLYLACDNCHINAAQELVNLGANVNRPDQRGNSPLHAAIINNHTELAKLLLNHASIMSNQPNEDEMIPLQLAAENGMAEVVQKLIRDQKYLNRQNKRGETALLLATGDTPLHAAVINDNKQIIEQLLKKGANINQPNKRGLTPQMLCAKHLLELFERAKIEKTKSIVKAELLAQGADCNAIDENGDSLLHLAVQNENLKIVCLLSTQPTINFDQRNKDNMIPQALALKLCNSKIARCLFDASNVDVIEACDAIKVENQLCMNQGLVQYTKEQ